MMSRKLSFFLTIALVAAPALHAQHDDVETRAMRDEMQRSMKDLRLESADRPYFISYKIVDVDRKEAQASFGALTSSAEPRNRILSVTVRVGDYDFDNTNFTSNSTADLLLGSLISGNTALPVDDNYDELRRKIWLTTDSAYKKAIEQLSAKKAALETTNRDEKISDFSKQPARQESDINPPADVKLADIEQLVRSASAVFRTLPSVESAESRFEVVNTTEHFLNSEGTSYIRQASELSFHASATVQNSNGETFADSCDKYGRSTAELPNDATLLQETKQVSDRLALRLHGKVAKRYNGPVLVEDEAAGQLFAHDFARLLSSHPHSSAGSGSSGGLAALLNGPTASLLNKVGSRVLPDFLTVTNNPQLTQLDGHMLLGNYKFDEEGVPPQETVLIKDGILKTLLTSRAPARGMHDSTGSMREHGVLPGNLIIDSTKSSTNDELKTQLIDLVKTRGLDYGYILRKLAGNKATIAIRVYPDGHEDQVRDARTAEITVNSFKDILAVSKERTIYSEQAAITSLLNFSAAEGDLVSYAVPSMLFEDMTIEHVPNDSPKPPVVGSPLASQ